MNSRSSDEMALRRLPEMPLRDGITRWTSDDLNALYRRAMNEKNPSITALQEAVFATIDILGARSKIAQGINAPLTSVSKMRENREYRVYLLTERSLGIGILKVGTKKLFVTHPKTRSLVEIEPKCVLDFYISEQVQRLGMGKKLFEGMLEMENLSGSPEMLAIDRPSDKFLNFMRRHYGLEEYTPEVNKFVVYRPYFAYTVVDERGRIKYTKPPSQATPKPASSETGVSHSAPAPAPRKAGGPGRNFLADKMRANGYQKEDAELFMDQNEDMVRYLK